MAQGEEPVSAASVQNSAYMMLTDPAYGRIVNCDPKKTNETEIKRKLIESGEACGKFEGLYMLQRQAESYRAALRAAHSIGDNEFYVDDGLVMEFKEKLGNKTYTGRETVSWYSLRRRINTDCII